MSSEFDSEEQKNLLIGPIAFIYNIRILEDGFVAESENFLEPGTGVISLRNGDSYSFYITEFEVVYKDYENEIEFYILLNEKGMLLLRSPLEGNILEREYEETPTKIITMRTPFSLTKIALSTDFNKAKSDLETSNEFLSLLN